MSSAGKGVPVRIEYQLRGDPISLQASQDGRGWRIALAKRETQRIEVERLDDEELLITRGDRRFRVPFLMARGSLTIAFAGRTYELSAPAPPGARPDSAATGDVTAPMSGLLTELLVRPGERIAAYQRLAVIEAMKVLAPVDAPFDGVVAQIHAVPGAHVELGDRLMQLERGDSPSGRTEQPS